MLSLFESREDAQSRGPMLGWVEVVTKLTAPSSGAPTKTKLGVRAQGLLTSAA